MIPTVFGVLHSYYCIMDLGLGGWLELAGAGSVELSGVPSGRWLMPMDLKADLADMA